MIINEKQFILDNLMKKYLEEKAGNIHEQIGHGDGAKNYLILDMQMVLS